MNELKIMQGYADRVTAALSPIPEEELPYAIGTHLGYSLSEIVDLSYEKIGYFLCPKGAN